MRQLQKLLYDDVHISAEDIGQAIKKLKAQFSENLITHELITCAAIKYQIIPIIAPLLTGRHVYGLLHDDPIFMAKLKESGIIPNSPNDVEPLRFNLQAKIDEYKKILEEDNIEAMDEFYNRYLINPNCSLPIKDQLFEYSSITLLSLAIQFKAFKCVNFLLLNGANPLVKTKKLEKKEIEGKEWDSMGFVGAVGNFKILIKLTENGGFLNDNFMEGITMFHHNALLKWFLENGIHINSLKDTYKTGILASCKYNNIEGLELWLNQIRGREEMKEVLEDYQYLFNAIKYDHQEILRLLIETGFKLNETGKQGVAPLIYAIQQRKKELVTCLLFHKANLDVTDDNGNTPLHLACANFDDYIQCAILDSKRVNVNVKNNNGDTPLHIVISKGIPDLLKNLLLHRPNLEIKNNKGYTPLLLASKNKRDMIFLAMLVEHGANINAKDNRGMTPLMYLMGWSIFSSFKEIMKLFYRHHADFNAKNNDGQTPLMIALIIGQNQETVKYLIQKDADVNAVDNNGNTPHSIALLNHETKLANFLVDKGAIPKNDDRGE